MAKKSTSITFRANKSRITATIKRPGMDAHVMNETFASEDEVQAAMRRLIFGLAGQPIPNNSTEQAQQQSAA